MSHKMSKRKTKNEIGVIGLDRMSGDLALQTIEKGWGGLYLVSDEASCVTGTTIFMDGGMALDSSFFGQA